MNKLCFEWVLSLSGQQQKKLTPSWQTNIMQSKNKRMGLVLSYRRLVFGAWMSMQYNIVLLVSNFVHLS